MLVSLSKCFIGSQEPLAVVYPRANILAIYYTIRMSDYDRVKAWRESKRKPCPGGCGTTVAWDTIKCRSCQAIDKREKALTRTLGEVKLENKSKRWTDHVRYFSREMYKFTACTLCGYSKHVEICHIKDIATFSDDTTIKEVNAENNIIGLCPNHHWEFDNNIL